MRWNKLLVLVLFSLLLISFFSVENSIPQVKAVTSFSCDFESGTLLTSDTPIGEWDTSNLASITTSPIHSGTYAGDFSSSQNAYVLVTLPSALPAGCSYSGYFYFSTLPTISNDYLDFMQGGASGYELGASVIFDGVSAKFSLQDHYFDGIFHNSTLTVSTGQWYFINVTYANTPNYCHMYVNGIDSASCLGPVGSLSKLELGKDNGNSATYVWYADDIIVDDGESTPIPTATPTPTPTPTATPTPSISPTPTPTSTATIPPLFMPADPLNILLLIIFIFFVILAFLIKEPFIFGIAAFVSILFGINLAFLYLTDPVNNWMMGIIGACLIFFGLFMLVFSVEVARSGKGGKK